MSPVLKELELRWRAIFGQLAAGDDCPPALRLRAEGLMEALALAGDAEPAVLQAAMARVYEDCFGRSLSDDCGPDWAEFFPFPQIPGFARRAPVFPSTSE